VETVVGNYFYEIVTAVILVVGYLVYVYYKQGPKKALEEYKVILDIAEDVVQAIEQEYKEKAGPEKKEIAKKVIEEILCGLGYTPNPLMIDLAIEFAVFTMNKVRKQIIEAHKGIKEAGIDSTKIDIRISAQ